MKTFVAKNPFVDCSGQSGIMVVKAEDLDKAISIIKEEFKNNEEFKNIIHLYIKDIVYSIREIKDNEILWEW